MMVVEEVRPERSRRLPRTALSTLLRLRRLQAAAVAQDLKRDPSSALAVVALIACAVVGVRALLAREPTGLPMRAALEAATAATLFALVSRGIARHDARRSAAGPFHVLLAQPGVASAWTRLQSFGVVAGAVAIAAALLLVFDPVRAALFVLATGAGAAVAAAIGRMAAGDLAKALPRGRLLSSTLAGLAPFPRVQAWRPWVRVRHWVAGGGVLLAGAAAARLALVNNPTPVPATALLALASLGAGAMAGGLDLPLVRFLGREPRSLASILAAICLPAAAAFGFAAGIVAALIGLGLGTATAMAGALILMLAGYAACVALHALGAHPRMARLAASLDILLTAGVVASFAPAAPVWIGLRTAMLWRSAGQGRWRLP